MTSFTVVLPTRERHDTLLHSLRTVVEQDYEQLTIIVSDNMSSPATRQVVESFADPRINYLNTGRRVGMSENFEFALSHVQGGWVVVLGDDDGLLPGALHRADALIQATGCEAISSALCNFVWPGRSQGQPGRLHVPLGRSGWSWRQSSSWRNRLMEHRADYSQLPYLYTGGMVAMSAVERMRRADGRLICSKVPDIYSALALSAVTERYLAVHEPLVIMGTSKHSSGSSLFNHSDQHGPAQAFLEEPGLSFHASLGNGQVASIPVLVHESYLQSEFLGRNQHQPVLGHRLALALAWSKVVDKPPVYTKVHDYVFAVAAHQGLSAWQVWRHYPRAWAQARARHLVMIRDSVSVLEIPGACDAQNIYQASWVAQGLVQAAPTQPWWKQRQAWKRITARLRP